VIATIILACYFLVSKSNQKPPGVPLFIRRFLSAMRCIKQRSATSQIQLIRSDRCALYKQSHTLRSTYRPHSHCQGRLNPNMLISICQKTKIF